MLAHPTLDKIEQLRLFGMAKALREQLQNQKATALNFEERLGLLIDRELTERENRRLAIRLRTAKLRISAVIEDVDFRQPRGLDKSLLMSLASNQWITEHHNLLILGPTGVGRAILPAPYPTRLVAMVMSSCIRGCRGFLKNSPFRTTTDGTEK